MKTWTQEYGAGFSLSHNWLTGNWSFPFPQSDGVHYVVRNYPEGLKPPHKFDAHFSMSKSANAKFVSVQQPATQPCRLRLYFQTVDDMEGASFSEDGRWWSNPACLNLDSMGTASELVVLLDPLSWSNVNGHTGIERISQFGAARNNIGQVGFTLGADFFGHGVYVSGGTATLTIGKLKIT